MLSHPFFCQLFINRLFTNRLFIKNQSLMYTLLCRYQAVQDTASATVSRDSIGERVG